MVDPMLNYIDMGAMNASYRAQIEEMQEKLKELTAVKAVRDRLDQYIENIEKYIDGGWYMDEKQPWDDDNGNPRTNL